MNIEQALCHAFCDGISVQEVPAGLAVATSFEDGIGDRIAFYVVSDPETGLYRLEDDGSLVPTLVAMGTKVTDGQRARVFQGILAQAGVSFDEETGELKSKHLVEEEIPSAALRFVTMLVRVAALWAMRSDLVMNTFREDAITRIRETLGERLSIAESQPIGPELPDILPDLILRSETGIPVALFMAVSDARLYEAIFLRMIADHEAHLNCSVVALQDQEGSRLVSRKMLQRAHNRLDAVPVYYGEESTAIERIAREAVSLNRIQ